MHLDSSDALSKLRRVAGMGLVEIRNRGRQESFKWIDRIRLDDSRVPDPLAALRRHAPELAGPRAVLELLNERVPARFFACCATGGIDVVKQQFPETVREILIAADRLQGGEFDLLGYRGLRFGNPIDWHLDPVHARRSPLAHWSRIDALDPASVGDSKVVWELNRHQWIVRLAQAFALTGDRRHAAAATQAIDQWLDANPPGFGINWSSSLEVAMRLMSWSWVLMLLRDEIESRIAVRMLASIHAHASHVQKYLSHYFSPNTHLTGEALGLFYAGTLFPEFRDAERWRATGASTLIEQADKQISDDGVYFEQSTCYQRYTCDIYLHFLALAARNGADVPERTREHVIRMVDFLVALRRPDGTMPAIGDADGGSLMPLAPRAADDFRGVLAVAGAMFERADFVGAGGDSAPEVAWLLGADGVDALTRTGAAGPVGALSRVFTSGGYAVMRTDWGSGAHQMIVDIGPVGAYGHGHADLLSIQCSIFGEPCLVDAGTFDYTAEPEWRDYFRGTSAHSTVTIDGQNQARSNGPFNWRQRPRATLREWQSTPDFDLVDAEHNAFVALNTPVIHRRRVLFVKPDFWLVVDDLLGYGVHSADLRFHFAPLPVALRGTTARAETGNGCALWVVPFGNVEVEASIACGQTAPIRGWHSPDYGRRMPAPTLTYSWSAALPARVLTVLYPDRQRRTAPPQIHLLHDRAGLPIGVRVEQPRVAVRIDGPGAAIERG